MELFKYTFRLDVEWRENEEKHEGVFLNQLKDYIKANMPQYALFCEISKKTKKPHIQGIIASKYKVENIRKRFKDIWSYKFVKPFYSIVEVKDEQKYLSYISKEGLPWLNNLLSQEEIDEFNEKYEGEDNIQKSITFTQKVLKEFRDTYKYEYDVIRHFSFFNYKMDDHDTKLLNDAKGHLLSFILKKLGNIAKVFDEVILQRIYNGVKNGIICEDNNVNERHKQYWVEILKM